MPSHFLNSGTHSPEWGAMMNLPLPASVGVSRFRAWPAYIA
jgi:hypothetical protein